MRTSYTILSAALLAAGALLTTACSSEETVFDSVIPTTASDGNAIHFTATLAPKGDNGGMTRSITTGTDGKKEILNVAWKKKEEIAVYYLKNDGQTHATVKAKVTYVDDNTGVATIETDDSNPLVDPKDGSTVKFVYPYWLAKDGDIDEDKLMNNQNGLLNTGPGVNISKNFDAATGDGTLSISAGTAITTNRVSLTNRCCICKISLGFSTGIGVIPNLAAGKTLTITVSDGRSYTISSPFTEGIQSTTDPTVYRAFRSGDVIYVAMLPVTSQNVLFQSVCSDNILFWSISNGVNLAASTFYRNIPLTLSSVSMINRTLNTSDGEVTLQDGDMVSGTGGENTQLKITRGATVYLNGVTNTGIMQNGDIPGIECLGDATIVLFGTNSVTGNNNAPGILVPRRNTLTIQGFGELYATGGSRGAGIGGAHEKACGNIVITGGTITATGKGGGVRVLAAEVLLVIKPAAATSPSSAARSKPRAEILLQA